MEEVSVTEIRRRAGDVLAWVAQEKGRFIVTRDGKPVAMLAPDSGEAEKSITATHFAQHIAGMLPLTTPVAITNHKRVVAELWPWGPLQNEPA